MQKHTTVYFKYFGYQIAEDCFCEVCADVDFCNKHSITPRMVWANDLHHIHGRIGKSANSIENLIGVCREHHNDAHNEIIKKDEMDAIHERFISKNW